jgi:hypothetical protein
MLQNTKVWCKFQHTFPKIKLTTDDYLTIAAKLFPYGDFFKWLSYGNGLWSHSTASG